MNVIEKIKFYKPFIFRDMEMDSFSFKKYLSKL